MYAKKSLMLRVTFSRMALLILLATAAQWGTQSVYGEIPAEGSGARHVFFDSIKYPRVELGAQIDGVPAPEDLNERLDFVVSLTMRNFDDLKSRVGHGERISKTEMEEKYLPSSGDYSAVENWLKNQGFAITLEDVNHTNVFAAGPIERIQSALGAAFARVKTSAGEFTSAISAPSLPAEISGNVLGIIGLQPHIRARAQVLTSDGPGLFWVGPGDLLRAYNAPRNLNGSGQTIAVIMASIVQESDLSAFYNLVNSTQSVANIKQIPVLGGPSSASQVNYSHEAPGDIEWSSGMASGAKVRLYAPPDIGAASIFAACSQILSDADAYNISVISMSLSYWESTVPVSTLESGSQIFASLGAAGITVFAASGDDGSNPGSGNPSYSPSNAIDVGWPASDPNVTGVGGTNMNFDPTTFVEMGESPWNDIPIGGPIPGHVYWATGGGYSGYFAKPSWQTQSGNAILGSSAQRCVPDVSAISTTNAIGPADLRLGYSPFVGSSYPFSGLSPVGANFGTHGPVLGTSLATPIWAGIMALINQARANQGLGPMGPLGPAIYPLAGTNAFTDITGNLNNGGDVEGVWFSYSDGNGAYSVGPGYDLCTGLGTPNIANLAATLSGSSSTSATIAPDFLVQPISVVVTGGTVALSAQASNAVSYQWYVNGTTVMPGATDPILLLTNAEMYTGDYICVATNSAGSTSSNVATVSLTSTVDVGRLSDLSCRALVGTGEDILIAGFSIAGQGSIGGSNEFLVRASGPALAPFGVSGTLPDPQLELFSGDVLFGTNNAWNGSSAIASAAVSAGAFPWGSPSSHDSALLRSLSNGTYTAQIDGQSGDSGLALAEVYELTPAGGGSPESLRLVNLSGRAAVGTGNNILVAGFVIGGSTSRTILIRASGPALIPYGLTEALPDPQLELYSGPILLSSNRGWDGSAEIVESMLAVGAFWWSDPSSNDSAILVTLPPGSYTAQVSGADGDSGVSLVEIYDVP